VRENENSFQKNIETSVVRAHKVEMIERKCFVCERFLRKGVNEIEMGYPQILKKNLIIIIENRESMFDFTLEKNFHYYQKFIIIIIY
jgi:hypothetical protein